MREEAERQKQAAELARWQETLEGRISLAGLPAGTYFLKVQASGADPSVINPDYSLALRIPRPLVADRAELFLLECGQRLEPRALVEL